jgi:hypothetical protein
MGDGGRVRLIVFTALALLVFATGVAHAAPGVWATGERVRVEIEQLTKLDLPDRPTLHDHERVQRDCVFTVRHVCGVLAYSDVIVIDDTWRVVIRSRSSAAIAQLAHEHLHKDGDATWLDEAAVSAYALDLCPTIVFRMWGERGPCDPIDADLVSAVRVASRRVTGEPAKSYAARRWRAALWQLHSDEREPFYTTAWESVR